MICSRLKCSNRLRTSVKAKALIRCFLLQVEERKKKMNPNLQKQTGKMWLCIVLHPLFGADACLLFKCPVKGGLGIKSAIECYTQQRLVFLFACF